MRVLPRRLGYNSLAAAVSVACATTLTTTASAQQQQEALEEITVTGSFISRSADRPQPVAVLDTEEIRANQRVTLAEVVRDMPQIIGTTSSRTS